MAIPSEWAGPPVEWAELPVSPTLPCLRASKVCLMRTGHCQNEFQPVGHTVDVVIVYKGVLKYISLDLCYFSSATPESGACAQSRII